MTCSQQWFRINKWSRDLISRVEVLRETAQQVVVMESYGLRSKECRRAKVGEYFPTFEEAKAYLVETAKADLQKADDARSRAIEKLKQYQALAEVRVGETE